MDKQTLKWGNYIHANQYQRKYHVRHKKLNLSARLKSLPTSNATTWSLDCFSRVHYSLLIMLLEHLSGNCSLFFSSPLCKNSRAPSFSLWLSHMKNFVIKTEISSNVQHLVPSQNWTSKLMIKSIQTVSIQYPPPTTKCIN